MMSRSDYHFQSGTVSAPLRGIEQEWPVRTLHVSDDAVDLDLFAYPMHRGTTERSRTGKVADSAHGGDNLARKLFDAVASAKIWAASVAMHLPKEVRARLFRQLDLLHASDVFDEDTTPVSLQSFKTLVRAILQYKIASKPSLALMPNGNVLAIWKDAESELNIEFMALDEARWLVRQRSPDGRSFERAGGSASVVRLGEVLAPYGATRWFHAT